MMDHGINSLIGGWRVVRKELRWGITLNNIWSHFIFVYNSHIENKTLYQPQISSV